MADKTAQVILDRTDGHISMPPFKDEYKGRIHGYDPKGLAPPEYGIDANTVKTITIPLTNALMLRRYEIGGNFLWAIDATSLGAELELRFNDQNRDPVPINQGIFIAGVRFSRCYVSCAAQPGETITLVYGRQEADNIRVRNPSIGFNIVNLTKATVLETVADINVNAGAQQLLLAANPNRRIAFIRSPTANVNTMRIGDVNTAIARGVEISPGEIFQLSTTEAIYAFNTNDAVGGNESLSISWTED